MKAKTKKTTKPAAKKPTVIASRTGKGRTAVEALKAIDYKGLAKEAVEKMKAAKKQVTVTDLYKKNPNGLLRPVIVYKANGKIESITGFCPKEGCKNQRTVHAADWFQVRFCKKCQLEALMAKQAERAKDRRWRKQLAEQGKKRTAAAMKDRQEAKLVKDLGGKKVQEQLKSLVESTK